MKNNVVNIPTMYMRSSVSLGVSNFSGPADTLVMKAEFNRMKAELKMVKHTLKIQQQINNLGRSTDEKSDSSR